MCIMYLGMLNYISMLHANNPIHVDLWQYVMISPVHVRVHPQIQNCTIMAVHTHKDSRVRKVPEYTAKRHTFYL